MKVGTKSLLFGVHQFLWHPICVARAWRLLYQRWPTLCEWVAIFLHDVGYWGCQNMDGPEGKNHPLRGADLFRAFVVRYARWRLKRKFHHNFSEGFLNSCGRNWWMFCAGHSCHFSRKAGIPTSDLYRADKVATLMEPAWFYLLRAWLSGEGKEYVSNSPMAGTGLRRWFRWYRKKVVKRHLTSV